MYSAPILAVVLYLYLCPEGATAKRHGAVFSLLSVKRYKQKYPDLPAPKGAVCASLTLWVTAKPRNYWQSQLTTQRVCPEGARGTIGEANRQRAYPAKREHL